MINSPVTIEELENIDFFSHTDETLDALSERISKECQKKRKEIFNFLIENYRLYDQNEEYRIRINSQIEKVIHNHLLVKEFSGYAKNYLRNSIHNTNIHGSSIFIPISKKQKVKINTGKKR